MRFFVFVIIICTSFSVYAHHKIYSPEVEEGRQTLEWRGHFDIDSTKSSDKAHHHVIETEYSWTNFWQSELEFHISDNEGYPLDWEKTEFQNQLQIFDYNNFKGALYFSYNFVSKGQNSDEIEYKYLNKVIFNSFSFTTNFIFEKQVGVDAENSTEFSLSNYLALSEVLENQIVFGIIGFSEFGEISRFNTGDQQQHQYGVQLEKEFDLNNYEIEIALAWLKGLSDSCPDNTILWNFEFEF